MVRLKDGEHKIIPLAVAGFNSTMVRLKAGRGERVRRKTYRFQFHNGSIKSIVALVHFDDVVLFQFHNGSIKSHYANPHKPYSVKFQFHNGSIKREVGDSHAVWVVPFQFHNGSIKSRRICSGSTFTDEVSIPQWFD